jgi:uncharacterized protein YukE
MRGHLRTCGACRCLVQDEAAIADAAEILEPVEPPPELWARIERELGDREIDDSRRSSLWLVWPRLRQAALPLAVAAAAILAVVSFGMRGDSQTVSSPAGPELTPTPVAKAPVTAAVPKAVADADRFRTVRAKQITDAEQTYLQTIADLEALVSDVRPGWKAKQQAAYRRAYDTYRAEVRAARNRLADRGNEATIAPEAHDPLFAVYQGRIRFLQRVSFGEAL